MQIRDRFAALDLARFIAAMIVFLGHLFFLPQNILWSENTRRILSPIEVGDTAVLFFYALSGFVLTIGSENNTYIKWFTNRILRLYPIYICAWIFGFILVLLHKPSLLNMKVVLLGLLGAQSLDNESSLVINGPLWSLSVEILFSGILFYLLKLRNRLYWILILIGGSIWAWSATPNSAVLRAAPYFLIGIFLRSEKISAIRFPKGIAKLVILVFCAWFTVMGARHILGIPFKWSGEVSKLLLIATLIFLISRIQFGESFTRFSISLGKRSFCIYAFHYPVLLIFDFLIDPKSLLTLSAYGTLSVFFTYFVSELAFRYIDLPSINKLKKLTSKP